MVLVNSQAERLFGYTRAELLEQPIEMLVPDRHRANHPRHRTRFFGDPKVRPMGARCTAAAKTARRGPLTADQEKQLRTVQSSAKHLLSLINDLLDLAKIESGKVELNLQPNTGQGVVQDVATALRPTAEHKGLKFEVSVPPDEITVRTDRGALNQILINLTSNAIKFNEQGSVRLELR